MNDNNETPLKLTIKEFGIIAAIVCILFFNVTDFDEIDIPNLPSSVYTEPYQVNIPKNEQETFRHELKNGYADVTKLAEYKIYGRIYETRRVLAKISTAGYAVTHDISIGCGELVKKQNFNAINTTQVQGSAGRIVYWSSYNSRRFTIPFAEACVSFTNNHVFPANDRIAKQLDKLTRRDLVYMEGYLIKADVIAGGKNEHIYSSMTRTDDTGTTCETIYVTKLITKRGTFE